ncbi:MAG: DMT family transporter [Anaerovoracaceae bacterium]|nr:DMT family transporter [Bacillota bacterium]MDY3954909.1 DMT family transporter [Anaerovoracaceae bacterium]
MNRIKCYFTLALAVTFWCSAFVVSKIALDDLPPITLCTCRFLIAFCVLYPFVRNRGFRLGLLFRRQSFLFGISGTGSNLVLLTIGLTACSAGMSSIAHGLFPVFMVFFGYIMLKERMNRFKWVSVIFSLIGVAVACAGNVDLEGTKAWGVGLVILSVFTWAFYSVFVKKHSAELSGWILTEVTFGTAFLACLPLAIIECIYVGNVSFPEPMSWVSILYLSIFSSIIGIGLWNIGVKEVSPAVSGVYFNLTPAIGLAIAVIAGEGCSWMQVVGCALIVIGVLAGSKGDMLEAAEEQKNQKQD